LNFERSLLMHTDSSCTFCKIVAGQIPSRKVFEDDELLVFHDVAPWAPVHVLIIPKEHVATMYELEGRHAALLGRMLLLAPQVMRELGAVNGFRTIINTGDDGGQEVQHVHIHVMGGARPWAKG
jgi:histidine triad (HIT) family protein